MRLEELSRAKLSSETAEAASAAEQAHADLRAELARQCKALSLPPPVTALEIHCLRHHPQSQQNRLQSSSRRR